MNPLEGNDWMAILNDPKRVNQYIESRKKGNRMNPTCITLIIYSI